MSEPFQPSGRFHRVTTRRRNLRVLQCPLEPELLVAEFAGELPPEVATAVREHIAVCEICGERSRALQTPYQVIASLGNQPVPYVPDLRDKVRVRLRHTRPPGASGGWPAQLQEAAGSPPCVPSWR